jgi:hypothetical protein
MKKFVRAPKLGKRIFGFFEKRLAEQLDSSEVPSLKC